MGEVKWFEDDYNGYYDLGVTNKIYIESEMTRAEIISYANKLPDFALERFIQGYPLTKEELNYFKNKYKHNLSILNCIAYHQEKDFLVYERQLNSKIRTLSNSKFKI